MRERNTKPKLLNRIRSLVASCLFASLHPWLRVIATFENPINKGSLCDLCASSLAPFHCFQRPWCYSWPLSGMGEWLFGLQVRLGITLEELDGQTGWNFRPFSINNLSSTPLTVFILTPLTFSKECCILNCYYYWINHKTILLLKFFIPALGEKAGENVIYSIV